MTDDVEIKFGADTSGVDAGVGEVKSDLESVNAVAAALREGFAALAVEIKSALSEPPTGLQDGIRALEVETERENASLKEMVLQVHEGVSSFNDFKNKIGEIAEVWMAAFAVERIIEMAKQMGEAAEKVEHLAMGLGMTTDEIQKLQSLGNASGSSLDQITAASVKLDRALAQAHSGSAAFSAAFTKLGVDINEPRTQFQLTQEVMEKFGEMAPGIDKVQIATALFGRNLVNIAPLISMSKEEMADYNEQAEKYGVVNENAIAQGAALGAAFNENKNAMQGIVNIVTEGMAPALTVIVKGFNDWAASLIESYKQGGTAKTMVDGLVLAVKILVDAVVTLGTIFDYVFKNLDGAVWMLQGTVMAVFDSVMGQCQKLGDTFGTLGTIIVDSLTGHWDKIEGDFQKGLDKLHQDTIDTAKKIATDVGVIGKGFAEWGSADKDAAGADKFLQAMWGGGQQAKAKPQADDAAGIGDGRGGGKPKDDKVQVWEEQLHEMEQASDDYFTDQKANELAFWTEKLELTTKGTKDWLAVQSKIYDLDKAMAKDAYEEKIATYNAQIAAQQAYSDKAITIEQDKVSFIVATYGADSKEAQNANRELERMQQEHQKQMLSIKLKGVQDLATLAVTADAQDLQATKTNIQIKEEMVNEQLKAGQITAVQAALQKQQLDQQMYAAEVASNNRQYELQLQAYEDDLKLQNLLPAQIAEIDAKVEQLKAAHYAKLAQMSGANNLQQVKDAGAAASAMQAQWTSVLAPITGGFSTMIQSMVNGTSTFKQAWANMGMSLESAMMGWVTKMVTTWVAHELAKTAATMLGTTTRTTAQVAGDQVTLASSAMTSISQIAMHAAVAAAGAYAAIASIPIVGPVLAPVAAAAALAGVLALGKAIFSAQDGWAQVPYDGAMTELHKDEMVLPASIASPLRASLSSIAPAGGGASSSGEPDGSRPAARGGSTGGPMHVHIHTMDAQSFQQFLDSNQDVVHKSLQRMANNLVGKNG